MFVMTRQSILGLMLAAGLFGAGALPACRQGVPPNSQRARLEAPAASPASQDGGRPDQGGEFRIVARQQQEETSAPKVTVKASYPQLSGGDETRFRVFNQALSDYVAGQIQAFKAEIKELNQPGPGGQTGSQEGSIEISYQVPYSDRNLVSVQVLTSTYAGGAHPNGTFKSFNYDLQRQRIMTLDQLFAPKAKYLRTIADRCINEIQRRQISDDESIRQGAAAREENYQVWNVGPKGLLITFDAYQVAPYATGPQEVTIPFSALRGILQADGPLSSLIKPRP
jgi:hypothetical protein